MSIRLKQRNLTVCFGLALIAACPRSSTAAFIDKTATLAPGGIDSSTDAMAWCDYNNDGYVDLLGYRFLYTNHGGTNFTLQASFWGGAVWGDYNNDGHTDLFSWMSGGHLYRNNGAASFTLFDNDAVMPLLPGDLSGTSGNQSQGACWGDFNNDGYLDLYAGNYEVSTGTGELPDAILMNNAGNSFTMTTLIATTNNCSRGVTACDFDMDGDLDIYVSCYRLRPNNLWLNNGSGNFTDVAAAYGVDGDGVTYNDRGHTIGSAWGDLDNDGHFDLLVGNFSHPDASQDRPKFMRNMGPSGNYHFELMRTLDGANWQESYTCPALGDYDNDGDLDIFYAAVYPGDTGRLWRNDGNWVFTDVTIAEGLIEVTNTYSVAWADFDNDGDLDLASRGRIYVNQGNANKWLKVRLEGNGTTVNRSAIGAQVRINLGNGKILTRQVEGATGKGNQNELTLHFGLGSRTAPVDLTVIWPDGETQTVTGVAVNQTVQVTTPPELALSTATLAPACTRGQNAPGQSFEVGNAFKPALTYSITDNAGWLSVTPADGTSLNGERHAIQVTYDTDGLSAGTYSATVTVTCAEAANSPQTIDVTLTVTPDAGDLPLADSFEPYAAGQSLAGTNGWSGGFGAGVVTALAYAAQTPPGYPLPAVAHTKVLQIFDALERVVNGATGQNVNVDFMMQAGRYEQALTAELGSMSQAALCADSNGVLHVWHLYADGSVWSPRWSSLGLAAIGVDQWVRVSVTMDYSNNPNGDTFFCPRVNGSLCPTLYGYKAPDNLTAPGPWYMCANSPGHGGDGARAISSLATGGQGLLDDVAITTNFFAHTGAVATNGVPFSWFDRWGVARAPDTDDDGDGFTAAHEFAAGTDPADRASSFRIVDTWVDNNRIYLSFLGNDSGSDIPFTMERATNGVASGWVVRDSAVPRAIAPAFTNIWSEPLQSSGPVFYRLKAPVTVP